MSGKTIHNLLFSPFPFILHVFILASWRDRSFSGVQPSSLNLVLQNQSWIKFLSYLLWCLKGVDVTGTRWPSCLSQMGWSLPSEGLSQAARGKKVEWNPQAPCLAFAFPMPVVWHGRSPEELMLTPLPGIYLVSVSAVLKNWSAELSAANLSMLGKYPMA